jgi:DeoR/GlpR family transcriptional regulator of sugar metabolism
MSRSNGRIRSSSAVKGANGKQPKKASISRAAATTMRRKFILQRVLMRGEVSKKEIQDEGKRQGFPFDDSSLRGDSEFFEEWDMNARRSAGEGKFISCDNRSSTFNTRLEEYKPEKEAIGQLAASILWGLPATHTDNSQETVRAQCLARIHRQLEQIETPAWTPARDKVRHALAAMAHKQHRFAILDAGTTTYATAQYVARPELLDSQFDRLHAGLRLLTNCPRIEALVDSPDSPTDLISLGGALRKDTLARTGILLERALLAMDIRADICMLGTTSVRAEQRHGKWGFTCDSEDEARTKSLLLESSDLRCLLMDSSKFERHRTSAFTFAALNSSQVDVIITDRGVRDHDEFAWKQFWDNGVAVLLADA